MVDNTEKNRNELKLKRARRAVKMAKAAKRARKKGLGIIQEFKEFALRGNMIDLAVGVVIGAAFNAIAQSFVNNIVMPFIGALTAGQSFQELTADVFGVQVPYGEFIQSVVNFFLVAFAVFMFVKFINGLHNLPEKLGISEEEKTEEEELKTEQTELEVLAEIRDLLKNGDFAALAAKQAAANEPPKA
jgi:large conductance mechanosensitive channel